MKVGDVPVYKDPDAHTTERVDDLLSRMTVAEKVGQLVGMFEGNFSGIPSSSGEPQTIEDIQDAIREYNIGTTTPFGTGMSTHNKLIVVARIANQLQKTAINETRLGIPILISVDAIHGFATVEGSTVFPHNLGMAATWDPQLVREAARITAIEMRAAGASQNCSPTADVVRDSRWGRTYETYGESPYLVGEMAAAEATGLKGEQADPGTAVAATTNHFPAHGAPTRGEVCAPTDVSPATLHRIFVAPFRRVVNEGVSSVVVTKCAVNGEPVHSSKRYLTDLLRDEIGFEGVVCADWLGIGMLVNDHQTAATVPEAMRQAVDAGIDLFTIGGPAFAECLMDAIDDGNITEERIDESVRRILTEKYRLGLFEQPFVDVADARNIVGNETHRRTALECARRSITLLKNDGVLPLGEDIDSVLVTGPNANTIDNLCGGWTVAQLGLEHGSTLVDGLADAVDGVDIQFTQGASVRDVEELEQVRADAKQADLAVVALGENWYISEFGPREITGPIGEFPTRSQLTLPKAQKRLLHTVTETGVSTVLILVSGRPLAIPEAVEQTDAVLMGYLPGLEGGRALAEVITGEVNPSGKLPITMPTSVGDLPSTHDWIPYPKTIGQAEHPPSYDPVFEFGHGLSYSKFGYRSLEIDDTDGRSRGTIDVAVSIENQSDRAGDEVIQVYVEDLVSSRLTPVRELKAFSRVSLDAGEMKRVQLTLRTDDLGVVQPDGSSIIEPGEFEVTVGGLSGRFSIDG